MRSLLNDAGEFFAPGQTAALFSQANLDRVEREFRAEIDAVVNAGLEPAHLDWHCLADGGREDIFDLTPVLAMEYGPALRAWLEPGRSKLRSCGLPVTDNPFLDSFSLNVDGKAARYAEMLRALPSGLTEWAVHPGLGDKRAPAPDPYGWCVRQTTSSFSRRRPATSCGTSVVVLDYRHIQQAWSQASAGADTSS